MPTGLQDWFSRVQAEMLFLFLDLSDTPGSYAGSANKNVRVNEAESGLEFGGAYFDWGLDEDKGDAGRKGRVWWAEDTKILYGDDGSVWVELLRGEAVSRLSELLENSHGSLTNVTSDQHHAQLHEGTHYHDNLLEVSEDQHHAQEHHADHENEGAQEISVSGLSGLLADPQTPIVQPKFSANKGTAGQQTVSTLTWTKITFTTEEYDIGSAYDAANSKWIPGKVGQAFMAAALILTLAADQAILVLAIYKNGVGYKKSIISASGGGSQGLYVGGDIKVDAITDYFEIYLFHTCGGDRNVEDDIDQTWFCGHVLV